MMDQLLMSGPMEGSPREAGRRNASDPCGTIIGRFERGGKSRHNRGEVTRTTTGGTTRGLGPRVVMEGLRRRGEYGECWLRPLRLVFRLASARLPAR